MTRRTLQILFGGFDQPGKDFLREAQALQKSEIFRGNSLAVRAVGVAPHADRLDEASLVRRSAADHSAYESGGGWAEIVADRDRHWRVAIEDEREVP